MVLHSHNLLLDLGMQLLILALLMHSLFILACFFSHCTLHFPLLSLQHQLNHVILHARPIPPHPQSITSALTNGYLVYYLSSFCIMLSTILFYLMVLLVFFIPLNQYLYHMVMFNIIYFFQLIDHCLGNTDTPTGRHVRVRHGYHTCLEKKCFLIGTQSKHIQAKRKRKENEDGLHLVGSPLSISFLVKSPFLF